ncbi:hypothetical protein ACFLQU_05055, partial [Verrucomicrobiota bacterium]
MAKNPEEYVDMKHTPPVNSIRSVVGALALISMVLPPLTGCARFRSDLVPRNPTVTPLPRPLRDKARVTFKAGKKHIMPSPTTLSRVRATGVFREVTGVITPNTTSADGSYLLRLRLRRDILPPAPVGVLLAFCSGYSLFTLPMITVCKMNYSLTLASPDGATVHEGVYRENQTEILWLLMLPFIGTTRNNDPLGDLEKHALIQMQKDVRTKLKPKPQPLPARPPPTTEKPALVGRFKKLKELRDDG